jgi:mannose-6-phosphate isomerase-like protein (cupin superfamily)
MGNPLVDDSWALQKGATMTILYDPLRAHVRCDGTEVLRVPRHWHAAHDELHVVLKGRITITQDGVRKVIGPDDGPCLTQRGVIHSLESFPGEEVILEETTTEAESVRSIFLGLL